MLYSRGRVDWGLLRLQTLPVRAGLRGPAGPVTGPVRLRPAGRGGSRGGEGSTWGGVRAAQDEGVLVQVGHLRSPPSVLLVSLAPLPVSARK
jgi:hypothetical protein